MTSVTLPDGSTIIDDSELYPDFQARRMAHEGQTATEIAGALGKPLTNVMRWIAECPYETPEAYWLRRYNDGTHRQDPDEDE